MDGLNIEPAANGGWIVSQATHRREGYAPAILAACTTDADLMAWLASWLGGRADAKQAVRGGAGDDA